MERTTVVASNSAPTATCATVDATMGSSGCAAFRPQATRVTNAVKPRQSCVIRSESITIAGRRTASALEYPEIARIAVQASTNETITAFNTWGHQLMP